jgi:hypothetical protein
MKSEIESLLNANGSIRLNLTQKGFNKFKELTAMKLSLP